MFLLWRCQACSLPIRSEPSARSRGPSSERKRENERKNSSPEALELERLDGAGGLESGSNRPTRLDSAWPGRVGSGRVREQRWQRPTVPFHSIEELVHWPDRAGLVQSQEPFFVVGGEKRRTKERRREDWSELMLIGVDRTGPD